MDRIGQPLHPTSRMKEILSALLISLLYVSFQKMILLYQDEEKDLERVGGRWRNLLQMNFSGQNCKKSWL